jgi:outer membrane protein assembly factor BamB
MTAFAMGLLLLAGQADTVSPTEIWPQWRGPTADSVAPGRGLPIKWSPTENIVWKTPLPGWGVSTPVIWKDAVFLTTQVNDRDLVVLRIDAGTGKIVWQHKVGEAAPRRKGPVGNLRFMDESNMATPSPVTDGKHVWFHFSNGDLFCYDFAGKQVWAVNLAKNYGVYSIWWGHANSPLIVDDLLICTCSQDPKGGGKSYVAALDKMTGKERWYVDRETGAQGEPADSYTTPLLFQNNNRTEVIVFGGNVLDAYDPATGKRLWHSHAFKGNRVISGPTLVGDTVYAIEGMKGPLFAIKAGGSGDVTETHVRWKFAATKSNPDASSPVFANGLVFMGNNDGLAFCVDAADGKQMWKERLGDRFRATPLVSEGKIYFFAKDGKTTIVEASREFKVLSTADLGEDVMASPAVAHGSLFLRTKGHLYRIGSSKN